MIVHEVHVFCTICNPGRMQGQDRGYARFVGVGDVEAALRISGWRRRWSDENPRDPARHVRGRTRPLRCPECVAEDRQSLVAAVPLPLFDGGAT